jgi:hypothetical protein
MRNSKSEIVEWELLAIEPASLYNKARGSFGGKYATRKRASFTNSIFYKIGYHYGDNIYAFLYHK